MEGPEDDLIVSPRIAVVAQQLWAQGTVPGIEAVPVNGFAE